MNNKLHGRYCDDCSFGFHLESEEPCRTCIKKSTSSNELPLFKRLAE